MLTTRHVIEGEPICHVYRDWADGMWQFFSNHVTEESDAKVLALEEVFQMDSSIAKLADLPPGWKASRSGPQKPWRRKKNHPSAE